MDSVFNHLCFSFCCTPAKGAGTPRDSHTGRETCTCEERTHTCDQSYKLECYKVLDDLPGQDAECGIVLFELKAC